MMFERSNALQLLKTVAVVGGTALTLSSCVSADTNINTTAVTPQGTVGLEKIKAGMPESVFKAARITFAIDTHLEASKGGKTQYISRTYTALGGQYVAQCKDEKCYELQVIYKPSVPKEDGLAALPNLVPPDAGKETFVDDSILTSKKWPQYAVEMHYFGPKYLAIVKYADKSGKEINSIDTYAVAPEKALAIEYGKIPKGITIPESSKTAVAAQPNSNSSVQ